MILHYLLQKEGKITVIEIKKGAINEVKNLLKSPNLQYWPLIKSADGPEIKYFGGVKVETRQTSKGPDDFYMLSRRFGWAVALVITKNGKVVLNIQPKPGLGVASLEMPAGGIGKDPKRTTNNIIRLTKEEVLRETGYGQESYVRYLGFSLIETGKMFDPTVQEPFEPGVGRGLKAHCMILEGVKQITEPQLASTEKIQPILVSVPDLIELVKNNVLVETSAVACVTLAYFQGHLQRYLCI